LAKKEQALMLGRKRYCEGCRLCSFWIGDHA